MTLAHRHIVAVNAGSSSIKLALGIALSEAANQDNEAVIATGPSRTRVGVIRTDEELTLARSVLRTISRTTTNNGT